MSIPTHTEAWVSALLAALEARDLESAEHCRRVASMTDTFCAVLALDERMHRDIVDAATIHDIGKICIPDGILFNNGTLTADDFTVMKRHSSTGAAIAQRAGCGQYVVSAILHHHERWDGNGYPHGLRCDMIPLGARLIALCDSLDAMQSERRYRPPRVTEKCRMEIERCAGTQFDPSLTEQFLLHWDEIAGAGGDANESAI